MMGTFASNGQCVEEKCGLESQDKMVEIRSIMVQQDSVFKEQVQALHRLYKVQKLEMQELEKRKDHLQLKTAELTDGFSDVSGLDDKSGELVRPVAWVYKLETGSLSLHPFCSLKLFEGSGSVSYGGSFQRLGSSQSKEVRDFDLERFPDGWVDESCTMVQPDNSSPTSKGSAIASVEEYESRKSNDTSEEGYLTTSSWNVVSIDTKDNQDSSPADPVDRKAKLSHQDSFASVNGCPNSSSVEAEENNSKRAAPLKTAKGITVAEVGFPKLELSHSGQTPPYHPQSHSSEGHSNFVPGSSNSDRNLLALKTSSRGIDEHASDIPVSEGVQSSELISEAAQLVRYEKTDFITPLMDNGEKENSQERSDAVTFACLASNTSVQLPNKVEAEESPHTSKRKLRNKTTDAEARIHKLMKSAESPSSIPGKI